MGPDPSHQLTERDIHDYQLPAKIGDKWKELVRAWHFKHADIKRIEKDQGGYTMECCVEVLMCWMGREGRNANVQKLAEALEKAKLKNVADELMCNDTTQVRLLYASVEIKHKLERNRRYALCFVRTSHFWDEAEQ